METLGICLGMQQLTKGQADNAEIKTAICPFEDLLTIEMALLRPNQTLAGRENQCDSQSDV